MVTKAAQTGTVGTNAENGGEPGGSATDDAAAQAAAAAAQEGGAGDGGTGASTDDNDGKGNDIAGLPDWAQSYIKDLRGEAAKRRTTAEQKAQEAAEAARLEALSEVEKAVEEATNKTREEMVSEFQTRLIKEAAKASLIAAGVTKPEGGALTALNLDAVTVNDEGAIEGLDEAVKTFVETYPGFVDAGANGGAGGAGRGNPGNRGGSSTKPDPNAALREAFRRMRGGGE